MSAAAPSGVSADDILAGLPPERLAKELQRHGWFVAERAPLSDLDDFDDEELLTEMEARSLETARSNFDEAAARFRRRDNADALWELEKALPDAFAGLSQRFIPKP